MILMPFTSEMLAPRLSAAAIDVAHRIRAVMQLDLDEYDMADAARTLNDELDSDQVNEAWPVLTTSERSAWRALLKLERPDGNRY